LSGLLACGSCPADYTIRDPTVIPKAKQTMRSVFICLAGLPAL
jgi:hypothetical protein